MCRHFKKAPQTKFLKVVTLNQGHSKGLFYLGEIFRKNDEYEKAMKYYSKSKEPKTTTRILEGLVLLK